MASLKIGNPKDCGARCLEAAQSGKRVALVPTMGALHAGHLSLLRAARAQADFVVVSIFVNPTQFGPDEDLDRYPRTFEADRRAARDAGSDLLYAPEVSEMYPEGFATYVEVTGPLTAGLCGKSRPGFFRGVTTVVSRLFSQVQPDLAYFGQKDAQQAIVVRKMASDLNMNLEIVTRPTVREPDGLALSSRNACLNPQQRAAAPALYRALCAGRAAWEGGERSAGLIRVAVEQALGEEPLIDPQYVSVARPDTLEEVEGAVWRKGDGEGRRGAGRGAHLRRRRRRPRSVGGARAGLGHAGAPGRARQRIRVLEAGGILGACRCPHRGMVDPWRGRPGRRERPGAPACLRERSSDRGRTASGGI